MEDRAYRQNRFSFTILLKLKTDLLIQSSLKTPLRALALNPGGNTHRIGGWSFVDGAANRAQPSFRMAHEISYFCIQLKD